MPNFNFKFSFFALILFLLPAGISLVTVRAQTRKINPRLVPAAVAAVSLPAKNAVPAPRAKVKAQSATAASANVHPCFVKYAANRVNSPQELLAAIHCTAKTENFDQRILEGLVRVESNGMACTTSPRGARGIGQFMPETGRRYGLIVAPERGIDERCLVHKAIPASARYLRFLLNMFGGDVRLALAGYNAGEGAVQKFGYTIPPYKETTQYVEKIGWFLGQTGFSLGKAYNYNYAVAYISPLYQGRSQIVLPQFKPNRLVLTTALSRPASAGLPNSPSATISGISPDLPDSAVDASQNAKPNSPARTRVVELEPRINTASVFFWKN